MLTSSKEKSEWLKMAGHPWWDFWTQHFTLHIPHGSEQEMAIKLNPENNRAYIDVGKHFAEHVERSNDFDSAAPDWVSSTP